MQTAHSNKSSIIHNFYDGLKLIILTKNPLLSKIRASRCTKVTGTSGTMLDMPTAPTWNKQIFDLREIRTFYDDAYSE